MAMTNKYSEISEDTMEGTMFGANDDRDDDDDIPAEIAAMLEMTAALASRS